MQPGPRGKTGRPACPLYYRSANYVLITRVTLAVNRQNGVLPYVAREERKLAWSRRFCKYSFLGFSLKCIVGALNIGPAKTGAAGPVPPALYRNRVVISP